MSNQNVQILFQWPMVIDKKFFNLELLTKILI